ncbi:MAG: ABC transporter substrate-binding protein [Pseudomonadota bacterium]
MTRLSRRRLLTSGAAASMLAATAFATQAQPVRGGALRLALPARGSGAFRELVSVTTVFNRLTATDADGGLRGELATAWEASSDARDWSLTLRRDVQFHDGSPMTAADVAASLASARALRHELQEVRADGPDRVRIRLTAGNPGLPFLLSDASLAIAKDGLGTGPYRRTEAGLDAVEGYFDNRRPGWFDRIDFVSVPTPRDLADAVQTGLADVAELCDPAGTRIRHGRPAITTMAHPYALQITAQGAQVQALAQSLKLGIDRAALLKDWLGGKGAVAADYPTRAAQVTPSVDRVQARAILRQANLDQATLGLSDDLVHCPATARLLRALSRDARAVGLSLALADRDGTRPADLEVSLKPLRMTPEATLADHPPGGLENVPHFDDRLAAARAAASTADRWKLLHDLEQDVARHSTTVIPVLRDMAVIHTPRLDLSRESRARSGPHIAERWAFT